MMVNNNVQLGFGGGCHWCTEAVFKAVKGVVAVKQGWIASTLPNNEFSEAVLVTFNSDVVSMADLIRIHLYTHSSTSEHSMRKKYRSAIYYFDLVQKKGIENYLEGFQSEFDAPVITKVLPFESFKISDETYQNYYEKNPEKPFCKLYIDPKLKRINELID